MAVTEPVLLEG